MIQSENSEPLSLREAEHLSSFMIQSENLRALKFDIAGDETGEAEHLSSFMIQSESYDSALNPTMITLNSSSSCWLA